MLGRSLPWRSSTGRWVLAPRIAAFALCGSFVCSLPAPGKHALHYGVDHCVVCGGIAVRVPCTFCGAQAHTCLLGIDCSRTVCMQLFLPQRCCVCVACRQARQGGTAVHPAHQQELLLAGKEIRHCTPTQSTTPAKGLPTSGPEHLHGVTQLFLCLRCACLQALEVCAEKKKRILLINQEVARAPGKPGRQGELNMQQHCI